MCFTVYSLADFSVEFESSFGGVKRLCTEYEADGTAELKLCVTEDDIAYEKSVSEGSFSDSYLETVSFYRKLGELLPQRNAFVLHSALLDVDGIGVAFAAHSGTGKTTHMRLWKQLLGDRVTVVNGDKPIIRRTEDGFFGYGTPWDGKEHYSCNMKTPVKHICFIERNSENSCEEMSCSEAVNLIFNQVYMPHAPQAVFAAMQLINSFLGECSLWKIKCNMDIGAAETAYNKIFL